ncbi:MAG: phosphoglycerate kinase [Chlamydiia bacterium]|nr:phosphoglycerate kinase [Chlamydiia bacterium]
MKRLSIRDLPVQGKKILMRVDFNVPLDNDFNVTDPSRIVASLPSIQYLLENEASIILMSHLGQPHGSPNPELSLAPVAKVLGTLLEQKVIMAPDCVGQKVKDLVTALQPKEILLLENLRFHRAEESPGAKLLFAKELASFADFYVDDAFGCAHRKHSSITEVPKFFPNRSAAGFLLEKETSFLGDLLESPERPFYAIIGGAKISSKIGVIKALLHKVDAFLIGGGMAFTFLKAQGKEIGNSLYEADLVSFAKEIIEVAQTKGIPVLLPIDVVAARKMSDDAYPEIFSIEKGIPFERMGLDIGPETIEKFSQFLQAGKTVLWNGPLGVFEFTPFAKGTFSVAKILAALDGATIVGGGDLIAAINLSGVAKSMTHISTGGGATLEFIEHGSLPGLEALIANQNEDLPNINFMT